MTALSATTDPALLVGLETADDAGVYQIDARLALVETTDIITPLVDDPYTFGRIAAANALSDVYAMGGRPVTAMNLVFFPGCSLPLELLKEILVGGESAVREAGACLVGGHTVDDDELKYGLAVTGLIAPEQIVRNSTARPGDRLILTKPLGTGIVATAIKGDMAPPAVVAEAVRWMTTLNAAAARLMLACRARAATDVTGFGLVGHAIEMARGGGVTIQLAKNAVPLMPGVIDLVRDGMVPAGCYRNRDHFAAMVAGAGHIGDDILPWFDPQTSGGLLIALSPADADEYLEAALREGVFAVHIGNVVERRELLLEIV